MTTGSASVRPSRLADLLATIGRHPLAFWSAFLLVHLWLCLIGSIANNLPLGDVTLVYKPWAMQAAAGGGIVGVTEPWVYPLVAIVPIMLPLVAGPDGYQRVGSCS